MVVSYDINARCIVKMKQGKDFTREVSGEELTASSAAVVQRFPTRHRGLHRGHRNGAHALDDYKTPDLTPLVKTSESKVLRSGDIVNYESTVYSGAAEGVCRCWSGYKAK